MNEANSNFQKLVIHWPLYMGHWPTHGCFKKTRYGPNRPAARKWRIWVLGDFWGFLETFLRIFGEFLRNFGEICSFRYGLLLRWDGLMLKQGTDLIDLRLTWRIWILGDFWGFFGERFEDFWSIFEEFWRNWFVVRRRLRASINRSSTVRC